MSIAYRPEAFMPLDIKDDATAQLVAELARFPAAHPLLPATGEAADKEFFDALSEEP